MTTSVITDILNNLKESGYPVVYHLPSNINTLVDELNDANDGGIVAVVVAPVNGTPVTIDRRIADKFNLSISFVTLNEEGVDFDAEKNEAESINKCRVELYNWFSNYTKDQLNSTAKMSIVSSSREYLKYDAILTGYTLTFSVTEFIPTPEC